MAITVGRWRPPAVKVSIVDLRDGTQVEFDTPSDLLSWLDRHGSDKADIGQFVWATTPPQGGH